MILMQCIHLTDSMNDKSYGTMHHVRSGKNTHCRRVGNRRNFAYVSLWNRKYGR